MFELIKSKVQDDNSENLILKNYKVMGELVDLKPTDEDYIFEKDIIFSAKEYDIANIDTYLSILEEILKKLNDNKIYKLIFQFRHYYRDAHGSNQVEIKKLKFEFSL